MSHTHHQQRGAAEQLYTIMLSDPQVKWIGDVHLATCDNGQPVHCVGIIQGVIEAAAASGIDLSRCNSKDDVAAVMLDHLINGRKVHRAIERNVN